MGCGSSKTFTKLSDVREEFHVPLKKRSNVNEDFLLPKKGKDDNFITVLCASNSIAKRHNQQHDSALLKSCESMPSANESENSIVTMNSWELLAGLQDDNKEEKEAEERPEKGCWSRTNSVNEVSDSSEIPELEFARTLSLRDWLMQGGQMKAKGSYVHEGECGIGKNCDEVLFDPDLVSQFEQAVEELTVAEEEILKYIVHKWEGIKEAF